MKKLISILAGFFLFAYTLKAYSQTEPRSTQDRLPVLCALPNDVIEIMFKNGFSTVVPKGEIELVTREKTELVEFTDKTGETFVVIMHPIRSCVLYTYKKAEML